MVTFTRAQEVSPGEGITSTQHRALSRAFNDRFRLIADLPWRLSWYWFNLFRQVRNPDATGFNFPPQGEWFEFFAHIDPEHADLPWPPTGPGEPEGANLGSAMMQWLYGNAAVFDEPERLAILPLRFGTEGPPSKPSEYWDLGKAQRGGIDIDSGAMAAPAFDAAISLFRTQNFHPLIPHHKSYGGWFPTPVVLLDHCGEFTSTGLNIPSYQIQFTALRADVPIPEHHGTLTTVDGLPRITYAGTCPCGTDEHAAGHVLWVNKGHLGYDVFVSTGVDCGQVIDTFPARDWIEGPYEGTPYLAHDDGSQIPRVASWFAAEFRGSQAQRTPDSFQIERIAFPQQEFAVSQYPLAPARGRLVGDILQVDYPTARWTGAKFIAAETPGQWTPGQTDHAVAENFVASGWFLFASKLQTPVRVELLDGDRRLGVLTLTPDSAGDAEALQWFGNATAAQQLRVRLATDATFHETSGEIIVEVAELLSWKPFYWDTYLVTRAASSASGGEISGGVDTRGIDSEAAREMGEGLLRWGCIINAGSHRVAPQPIEVGRNPVYDAARRLVSQHLRITHRRQLVGYEVEADGTCHLYFKRFVHGLSSERVDAFRGIAPPLDAVEPGGLVRGETYVVRAEAGHITYRGADFRDGDTFTADRERQFEEHGDAKVHVHDGIRHRALRGGMTNEWVMVMETRPYHPSNTSIWSPAGYTDYFTFTDRCLVYPYTMPFVVRRHVAYNHQVEINEDDFSLQRLPMSVASTIMAPEAPPGMRYSAGTNRDYVSDDFCKSCQIYPSPYEVESCTVHDWAADQVIKVTLKSRLRTHPDAPATVSLDAMSWDSGTVSALRAESWRTDDNAVREYIRHQVDGSYQASWKTGDCGTGSGLPGLPDAPFGSVYPTFHFVHLIPEPFEDGNSVLQSQDTRCLVDAFVQMEVFLRAACEAFVDDRSSAALSCELGQGGLYDYSWENLCFDAFQGRWVGAFAASVRPDGPPGFGPLPNTEMWAEVFNRLAKGVNLLTRLRVDLPFTVSYQGLSGSADRPVAVAPDDVECTTTGSIGVWHDGAIGPEVTTPLAEGGWDDGTGFVAFQSVSLVGCPYAVRTTRLDVEWKVAVDPVFEHALPDWLAGMWDEGRIGLVGQVRYTTQRHDRKVTTFEDGDACCRAEVEPCPGHWLDGAGGYLKWVAADTEEITCGTLLPGIVTAPHPPRGDLSLGRDADMLEETFCGKGPLSSLEVQLYDDTPFVAIPLEDLEAKEAAEAAAAEEAGE